MSSENGLEIAIVGMNGRFPGAPDLETYWKNLLEGKEGVRFFSDEELKEEGIDQSQYENSNYVKAGTELKDIDKFDAAFFGFTPREAEVMDPQQRLFLECCWEVLETAGYDPEKYLGRIGVYAGVFSSTYLFNLYSNPSLYHSVGELNIRHGNEKDYLATRVSYKLNLKGPSVSVQTSCSTSLVAVHFAVQNLLSGECDMAIAGGVSIITPQKTGYMYQEGGVLSPDGHCRPFDAKAKGTIFGNGVGAVVLKRLEDARKDGDTIFAVIKGSAVNNDGADKVGFTAPSVNGQAEVIADAMAMAEVDPFTVEMVEAHGTGTALGDPIEVSALTQVYREQTDEKNYCAIGSVKSNIGHLGVASGVAGLIKVALSLYHKKIPPTLHFEEGNPNIDFANSPFYVNTKLLDWKEKKETPRRAAISSFGMGGTNAHVVLEEALAPELQDEKSTHNEQLLVLSAQSDAALGNAVGRMKDYFQTNPDVDLSDVSYTLQAGRREFSHRALLVAQTTEEALEILGNQESRKLVKGLSKKKRKVAFVFPGQGSQYVGMAHGLYVKEPVFRKAFDYCCDMLLPLIKTDLRKLLYQSEDEVVASEQLQQTSIAQPAIFAIEYSLAKLLDSWGVKPSFMLGHSIGEYVAACLAGVFSLEDALQIVATRGRLMQQMPAGKMLSVALSELQAQEYLEGELTIAAVNAPNLCVIAGKGEEIEALHEKLQEQGVETRMLITSHAFHSAMMNPILDEFANEVSKVQMNTPTIPYLSNLTGTWIKSEEATDPKYWSKHLRGAVRFTEGVETLLEEEIIVVEVGPGQSLTGLIKGHVSENRKPIVFPLLRHPKDRQTDNTVLLSAIGRLWLEGGTVDWEGLHTSHKVHRIPLPTYPFERKRFWVDRMSSNLVPVQEKEQNEHVYTKEIEETEEESILVKTEYLATDNKEKVSPLGIEQKVGAIWEELFGIESIDVNDDFFEIGGHSLLAIQLFNRIQEDFDVELQIEDMFDDPTIAGLAKLVNKALESMQEVGNVLEEASDEEIEELLKELEGESLDLEKFLTTKG
ncbi:beta-ketoacyl synthase N-terminal-like domain-containing protein [Bacillus subtilis]|uniref:type I polyketide synthase n=2 Tax=Bacillus TaxID=1386 RepID=UPI00053BAA82|nr:type I polyketide synthase [Bacillus subtilis]QAW10596.1 acyltransferase domain-containing protein [Bacillus subtilis]WBC28141.1 beta-ketoacyl synthase N-terminal-like domain-containing protein [Bacillus subtilis]